MVGRTVLDETRRFSDGHHGTVNRKHPPNEVRRFTPREQSERGAVFRPRFCESCGTGGPADRANGRCAPVSREWSPEATRRGKRWTGTMGLGLCGMC